MDACQSEMEIEEGAGGSTRLAAGGLRAGVSSIAIVLAVMGLTVFAVGFVSWKFPPAGFSGDSKNFFDRTSAAISEAFRGMFAVPDEKPALEINLAEQRTANSSTTLAVNDSGNGEADSGTKISSGRKPDAPKNSGAARTGIHAEENNSSGSPVSENGGSGSDAQPEKISPPAAPPDATEKISACDFSSAKNPNHKILFSEVAWMGDKEGAGNEWIELRNNSGNDLRLARWQIASEDKNLKIVFGDADNFRSGGFYLLERTDDNSAPGVPADKIYSGALSNGGAHLKIFDADCALADEIDASRGWPAGDAGAKKTMERSVLDLSWHTSGVPGGTPRAENSTAFSTGAEPSASHRASSSAGNAPVPESKTAPQSVPSSALRIFIIGVQITGGVGKANNDFVRIYNAGNALADISGWQVKKRTQSGGESSVKVFPAGAGIGAAGNFVWANSDNGFAPSVGANTSSTAYLADNNSIGLFDKLGVLVDSVAWGSGHVGAFVEGSAYPANPAANQTLSRKLLNGAPQDTNNNAEDFEIK